jgi:hypothetical protein
LLHESRRACPGIGRNSLLRLGLRLELWLELWLESILVKGNVHETSSVKGFSFRICGNSGANSSIVIARLTESKRIRCDGSIAKQWLFNNVRLMRKPCRAIQESPRHDF